MHRELQKRGRYKIGLPARHAGPKNFSAQRSARLGADHPAARFRGLAYRPGSRSLRRVAEYGDGWIGFNLLPDQTGKKIKRISMRSCLLCRSPMKCCG
jgi:hypothetical protein